MRLPSLRDPPTTCNLWWYVSGCLLLISGRCTPHIKPYFSHTPSHTSTNPPQPSPASHSSTPHPLPPSCIRTFPRTPLTNPIYLLYRTHPYPPRTPPSLSSPSLHLPTSWRYRAPLLPTSLTCKWRSSACCRRLTGSST